MEPVEPHILSGPSASTRLRFVWGLPSSVPAAWWFGLFCFYRRAKSQSTGQYYIPAGRDLGRYPLCFVFSLRGLMCWCCAVLMGTHLAVTGGLYVIYQKKPHNLVRYTDLALPWRWSGVSSLRGQGMLIQAKADFKARNMVEAFGALRAGLARYPRDTEARLQLATLYLMRAWRPQSDALLLDALNYGDPGLEYNRTAIAYIKDSDRPERVLEFIHRARALVANDAPSAEHLR